MDNADVDSKRGSRFVEPNQIEELNKNIRNSMMLKDGQFGCQPSDYPSSDASSSQSGR